MPWKKDENDALAIVDGNPVWIYEEGNEKDKEAPVDFKKTLTTISTITRESIQRKEKINEMKGLFAPLEAAGITDISEYLERSNAALDTVANLSDKEILDAGQVDNIKKAITEGYERKIDGIKAASQRQIDDSIARLAAKDNSIKDLVIKGAFYSSDFLRDKTLLLPDIAYSFFGDRFAVEEVDGKLVGYAKNKDGEKLMSIQNPGDIADPAEAIELMIADYPQKDRIMRMESTGSGLGNPGSTGTGGNLITKYKEAKAAGDVTSMVALKGQMVEQGIKPPL